MAVQVSQIQPKAPKQQQTSVERNPFGDILTLGGAAVGGFFGGLPGAATGASLGGMVGGMVAPPTVKSVDVPEQRQGAQIVATGGDAMSRRLNEVGQGAQNMQQIADSIDSLKYIQDENLKLKFAEPLLRADLAAQKNMGQV